MSTFKQFEPTPHQSRQVFKRHGIRIAAVANAIGLSYGYTSNILSGNHLPTPEVDAKLNQLAHTLEEEAA